MSDRKFNNPWSVEAGFVDLGSYEIDGLYYELYCFRQEPQRERSKLKRCVRNAREWSRASWQLTEARERRVHRRVSRDALQDARYWAGELKRESVTHVGARFGEHGDYQSASLKPRTRLGITRMVCHGYHGPIKEALARMGHRGLLTETIFDLNDSVIFSPADKPTEKGAPMQQLLKLWQKLRDVLVNDNGHLEEPFEHFPEGTDREEIWHWFEAQNPDFVVGDVQQGKFVIA